MGVLQEGGLPKGSIGGKRHLALWERNLVSGAVMIMWSVQRALQIPLFWLWHLSKSPEMPAKLKGGWSRAIRGGNHPLGHYPGGTDFLPLFFFLSDVQSSPGVCYLRVRVLSCLPNMIHWPKTWDRCALKRLICSQQVNFFSEVVVAPLWVQNFYGLRFILIFNCVWWVFLWWEYC